MKTYNFYTISEEVRRTKYRDLRARVATQEAELNEILSNPDQFSSVVTQDDAIVKKICEINETCRALDFINIIEVRN